MEVKKQNRIGGSKNEHSSEKHAKFAIWAESGVRLGLWGSEVGLQLRFQK